MGQIKNALQKQIDSNSRQKFFSTSGIILDYDKLYNRATVRYLNPNGEGYVTRRNVPVSSTLGGLSNGGVMPSQECTLSFVNGNIYSPIIIGVTSSTYGMKEHSSQGAFLVDESIRKVSEPDNISPMSNDWIDDNNQLSSKYDNDLAGYKNFNIGDISFDLLMNLSHFSETEQGMTHLETHSNMKMKDNGDIEIFVADNVGIRISKGTHKIYLYGFDVNINGEYDLLEIIEMLKNFKCRYEPTECECDMDFIRQSLNSINSQLQYIMENMNTTPQPHNHNISEATIELTFDNEGKLSTATGVETVRATIFGGDADDGCPVDKKLQCSGAKSITKVSDGVFDVVFDNPGFYVFITISQDSNEEMKVGTATTEICGPDGERGGSGQFVGNIFDSGWIDVDLLNGCYVDAWNFAIQVNSGHIANGVLDCGGVIGKRTDGTEIILGDISERGNIGDIYSGITPSGNSNLIHFDMSDTLHEIEGTCSLSDDIRQVKFVTYNCHDYCVTSANIHFNMHFSFDKSLWKK